MSAPATIVAPSGATAGAIPLKGGGALISPAPAAGGRRRRMTKKMKKMLKSLKKMGGDEVEGAVEGAVDPDMPPLEAGRRRRRGSRRSRRSRKSRRGFFA